MYRLLKKNELPLDIEIHTDPLSVVPAALSKRRAFKRNRIKQEESQDNKGGASKCLFCNPEELEGNPEIALHLDNKVMSFPNAAPFLPGDQRVICLWNEDTDKRYAHAHKFKFADFGIEEFYYLTSAAVQLAKEFPNTPSGQTLQNEPSPIQCIAGFNIGKLAGQSIPHFHIQYGWQVVLNPQNIGSELLDLYYREMREASLILYPLNDSNDEMFVLVPWTPKGQYHIEIHLRNRYQLGDLEPSEISKISYFAQEIISLYRNAGIQNMNILFTSSPLGKQWQPLCVQFIPRVNMTALYEMIGVNVVDTTPEMIASFFDSSIRWSDVAKKAEKFNASDLYQSRFEP
uniref:Galactose-1-phosphate uridylyltransferase n=1 Tax=Candidatus Kentrum sp. DK TaxID=2126562 RepID=A0A450SEM1_9GAMM|nr:MAG: Galactose-1-phosphate uridylyltransferase [Candidatus Kentron sp. DK]